MMMRSAAASCAASCSTAAATAAAATISSSTPARCRKTASSRTGGHRPAEPAPLSQENCRRAEVCETQWEYRRNLLALECTYRAGVPHAEKKAVSFRPIVDIQQFITENICDVPDKPDIEAMQQNIRDYKRHEQMAQRQEEKLAALNEIAKLYGEMRDTAGRWKLESFLVHWSRSETLQAQIDGREQEKAHVQRGTRGGAAEDRLPGGRGAAEGGAAAGIHPQKRTAAMPAGSLRGAGQGRPPSARRAGKADAQAGERGARDQARGAASGASRRNGPELGRGRLPRRRLRGGAAGARRI